MHLLVGETYPDDDSKVYVTGPGVAGWCHWPNKPPLGSTIDVELDAPGEASWDDIELNDEPTVADEPRAGNLRVWGEVVDVDEVSTLTLRLPGGHILLLDTIGEVPLHSVGMFVSVHLQHVTAYPTNI